MSSATQTGEMHFSGLNGNCCPPHVATGVLVSQWQSLAPRMAQVLEPKEERVVFKDWEKMNSEIAELGLWDDDEQPLPTSECTAGAGDALRHSKPQQQYCYAFAGLGGGQRRLRVLDNTMSGAHRCYTSAL